ncbi:MAG: hypothetical protein Q7S19_03575 [bacterium]|nr:hypothetical protein [bacterium]
MYTTNTFLEAWGAVLANSLNNVTAQLVQLLPAIVLAVVVFIVGWFIASIVGQAVSQVVKALKVDNALKSLGVGDLVSMAGMDLDSGAFVGALVKLFVIAVALVASLDILGLSQVNALLSELIVGFLPNVITVVILLLVAAVVADIVKRVVIGSARASGVQSANLLGKIASGLIWVVAVLMSLSQLNIGVAVLNTLFLGVVSGLALAFGLAFGLGGKDVAAYYLEKFKRELGQ